MKKVIITGMLALFFLIAGSGEINSANDADPVGLEYLKFLPEKPLLFGYARDLNSLMKKFDSSELKKQNGNTETFKRFTKSKIYMKIEKRFDDLNNAFSINLNDDFVRTAAGNEALLAIYDIGEVKFLFMSKIDMNIFEKTVLNSRKDTFETRNIDEYSFYYIEDEKKQRRLMFCWFDDTLLLSNDLTLFEKTLGLYTKKDYGEKNLLEDINARKLINNSKLEATSSDALIYLDFALINQTPYFKNYFLFNDVKDYLNYDKALISAFFKSGSYSEKRVTLPIDGKEFSPEYDGLLTSFEEGSDCCTSDYMTCKVLKSDEEKERWLMESVIKGFFSDFNTVGAVENASKRSGAASKEIYDYMKEHSAREGSAYFSIDNVDDFSTELKRCVVMRFAEPVTNEKISELVKKYIDSLFLRKVDVRVLSENGVNYIKMPIFSGLDFAFYSDGEYFLLANDKDFLIKIRDNFKTKSKLDNNPSEVIKIDYRKASKDFRRLSGVITSGQRGVDTDTKIFFDENIGSALDSTNYIDKIKYVKKPYVDYLYEEIIFDYL